MNKPGKNFSIIAGWALGALFLSVFQNSILNPYFLAPNLAVIIILFLVILKNDAGALVFSFAAGFLMSVGYAPTGLSSLILLSLSAILIMLREKALFSKKAENIAVIAAAAVIFYRLLSWLAAYGFALIRGQDPESFGFYFFNWGLFAEIIIAAAAIALIFKIKKTEKLGPLNV